MIAICQSKDEVNLIKKNYKDLPIILALNLETITFCKLNKINFILPFENISYHSISKKILLNSKKLLDSIDFKILQYDFLINDLKAIVRYKFHQIAFLIEIIQNLENTNQKIIYTDLYSTSKFFDKDYINIDQTLDLLNINNLKKIRIGNKHKSLKENKIFEYKISGLRYLDEKKVILNNAGYNFKRF